MRNIILISFGILGAFASGCSSATVVPPSDFAYVEGGDYEVRASSAEGVVIAVRENDNDMKGNLAFWSSVISSKLERAGYARDAAEKVTTAAGLEGQELRFQTTKNGRPHRYWINLFVTKNRVYLIEAGGDAAFFDEKTEKRVRDSVASFSES
jgi:hypothetical protein